jgi:hypothetical protein
MQTPYKPEAGRTLGFRAREPPLVRERLIAGGPPLVRERLVAEESSGDEAAELRPLVADGSSIHRDAVALLFAVERDGRVWQWRWKVSLCPST